MKKNTTDSLVSIIADCKDQQRSAQRLLYYRFYSYGLTVCLHYAQHREEAEEILQDGFLKAFQHIGQLQSPDSFRFWFRSILVRSAIDYYRKNRTREQFGTSPADRHREQTVENEANRRLEKDDIIHLLQELSPQYRMVFNLFVLEEYRHEEIAELLNISVNTSKSNLSRAKERLRQLLPAYRTLGT